MTLQNDYRTRAAHCTHLAQTAEPEQRALLFEMARAWMRLAEMSTRIQKITEEAPNVMPKAPKIQPEAKG